tara:strand:- start:703 stop:1047 length:345 start_codon:yes stop_codon:yes gene_type:complete
MEINGTEVGLRIKLDQLYHARREGCDIGDLTNGLLQAIAVNPLDAIEAAWLVYEPKLKAAGVETFEAFCELTPETMGAVVEQFREELAVFFPVLEAIQSEIDTTIAEITNRAPS